jgi:hypothetical protein
MTQGFADMKKTTNARRSPRRSARRTGASSTPPGPQRIVDLHAHVFNARCIPLASIIANAMGDECNALAAALGWLLQAITESSYRAKAPKTPLSASRATAYYVDQICNVVDFELRIASGADGGARSRAMTASELRRVEQSALMDAVRQLAVARGASQRSVDDATVGFKTFGALSGWARDTVRNGLDETIKRMPEAAWGEHENYAEFFYNMLLAEEHLAERLRDDYGSGLPPLRFVHHMMDMEKAYACNEVPPYAFWPTQMRRMETLQRHLSGSMLGFSAFDPRRDDWEAHATEALRMTGFLGFKFYPALGYKPIGNADPRIEMNVRGFFEFCIARDVPVFTHCTPKGFETLHHQGLNTHPIRWRALLASKGMAKLRLCLGHAGGETMCNKDPDTGVEVCSPGWMAADEAQWNEPDNFARIVVELCGTYENVYCELAYLTALLGRGKAGREALRRFEQNLAFARDATASMTYQFDDKLAYGSDWHMPSMVGNVRRYLDVFLQLRGQGKLDERFFWKTAYRYLRLP